MSNLGEGLARSTAAAKQGFSDTSEGQCISRDMATGYAVINVGGGDQTMPFVGDPPWPGEKVQVGYLGQKPVCLGAKRGAPQGTVTAVPAGNVVTVLGDDDVTYAYPYKTGEAFSVGTRVRLDHVGRYVIGIYSTEPEGSEFTPPPGLPPASSGSATFFPTDSANYRNGSYSDSGVEISDSRSGFYFYGGQIAGTIPDSATIVEASIYLAQEWDNVPGVPSRMGVHGYGSNAGEPPLVGALSVPGGTRGVNIIGFADALKVGTAFGVGFYSGFGWRRYAPGGSSGQIFMRWNL